MSKVYVIAIICVFDILIMVYSLFLAGVLCVGIKYMSHFHLGWVFSF